MNDQLTTKNAKIKCLKKLFIQVLLLLLQYLQTGHFYELDHHSIDIIMSSIWYISLEIGQPFIKSRSMALVSTLEMYSKFVLAYQF